ncbi:MAG: hypothetical protein KKE44_15990 [Proteobacteria bacterium]|nr:hypothetical protein [Pseudomonadota bacterium]MBU1584230.1 hypothetical protein [Pseudomonadota bacterium]MBU2455236.1 hypothetical protein [Pseudomonadota bacterium]MBU2629185.1 hypothetical protein [Pseudomonadota bacterium]
MHKKQITILVADDEESFRNSFVAKHSECGFSIEAISDIFSLPQKLRDTPKLPDLVVMDLYRTTASPGTAQAEAANAEVDKLLAKLDADTADLKAVVDRVKNPSAIKVLREIRDIPRLSRLPVLIYTRQGLSLLSDEEMRDAIHLGAEWMLKGRSSGVEQAQMNAFLRKAQEKRKRLERDIALTIFGAFLGAAVSLIAQSII